MFFFRNCCNQNEITDDVNERLLVIIRGDALANRNLGAIISELEQSFSIIALKSIRFTPMLVKKLYPTIETEEFYPRLLCYLTSGFHVAVIIEGENAIHRMVQLKGKSPQQDVENTLRKRFGISETVSCVHCSDTQQSAEREIKLFFTSSEIFNPVPNRQHYEQIDQLEEISL